MGQSNTIPRRINGVEGAAGQVMLSGGPGVLETWGAPAPAAHVHAAGDVTSGQFPLTRMPRAATGNFLEGNGVAADPIFNALIAGDIPNLDVAKITTGTFAVNRGGTGLNAIAVGGILYTAVANVLSRLAPGAGNQVLRSTAANALQFAALLAADIPALAASKITSGQFPLARMPRGTAGDVITGTGVGSDPVYSTPAVGAPVDAMALHINSNDTERTINDTSYVKAKETKLDVKVGAGIKIKYDAFAANLNAKARLYRNGAAIGIENDNVDDAWVTYSEDFDSSAWAANDLIQVYAYRPGGGDVKIRNLRFYYAVKYAMTSQDP